MPDGGDGGTPAAGGGVVGAAGGGVAGATAAPRLGPGALSEAARAVRKTRRPGVVHLGLGAFHRSHQAWYTQRAGSAGAGSAGAGAAPAGSAGAGSAGAGSAGAGSAGAGGAWGIVAFTGRRPGAAVVLAEQGGVYTLIERSADGDTVTLVDTILDARDGADGPAWRAAVADGRTAVITLTVTEAAYCRGADGRVDLAAAAVAADLERLRRVGGLGSNGRDSCESVPGRLVDGLRARRDAGSGAIAVVCCDNLTNNGGIVRDVVVSLAEAVDAGTVAGLASWILENVSFVSSMVDRITPATTDADRTTARDLTGFDDHAVVVAEPFAEWVVSGDFPAGRPPWENAGVRFVDDLEPYEQRKLWLLNAGHSLLAYLGLLLGHETIDEAMGDDRCVTPLEQLWDEAADVLPLPPDEIERARASLRERFQNPRIRHRLHQIAADGSVKLPVRVIDPLRERLATGRSIGEGAATLIAAWQLHLAEQPELVSDSGVAALGSTPTPENVLDAIAPGLGERDLTVAAIKAAEGRILTLRESSSRQSTAAPPTTNTGVPA